MDDANDESFHPIIKRVVSLLSKRSIYAPFGVPEPDSSLFFDEEAVEEIKEDLSSYLNSPELPNVVTDLVKLAYFLDQKGAKEASDSIMAIIKDVEVDIEAWLTSRGRSVEKKEP